MTCLGSLAFPMFILHGPLGQIFYKKMLGVEQVSIVAECLVVGLGVLFDVHWDKRQKNTRIHTSYVMCQTSRAETSGSSFFSLEKAKTCQEDCGKALGRNYAKEVLPIVSPAGHGCWLLYQRVLRASLRG